MKKINLKSILIILTFMRERDAKLAQGPINTVWKINSILKPTEMKDIYYVNNKLPSISVYCI